MSPSLQSRAPVAMAAVGVAMVASACLFASKRGSVVQFLRRHSLDDVVARLRDWPTLVAHARAAGREFTRQDLRWSYLVIGALVVVGGIINLVLPHGWTVWPFVAAVGVLLMVHEAADRNGQGVPPLHVYALVGVVLTTWLVVVMVLSVVNVAILLAGVIAVGFYGAQGYIRVRERERLIFQRRRDKLCIHCGHPINEEVAFCEDCGEEPDPLSTQLKRVASMTQNRRNVERARAVITPEPMTAGAKRREARLLASRQRRSTGKMR
jgi:hypothetical protein